MSAMLLSAYQETRFFIPVIFLRKTAKTKI